jgi:hypothetical protein
MTAISRFFEVPGDETIRLAGSFRQIVLKVIVDAGVYRKNRAV